MTAGVFVGASRQCCSYAGVLLAGVDRIDPATGLRRAMIRGVLYHLESAFVAHLRGLGESYVPGAGAAIGTPRQLLSCLDEAGIYSPEAREISQLTEDQDSWLHACLAACDALHANGLARASSSSSGGDIALYQDHDAKPEELSSVLVQAWLQALRELIDRHCALMEEY